MFLNYRNQENVLNRYFILMLVAVLSLAPFIYMVLVSFMSLGEATNIRILLPSELRFENYAKAWQQARFSNYFFNSVLVTLSTLICQLVICSLAGYAFAVIRFRGHQIVFMLVLITLMVPESVLISPLYQIILGRIVPIGFLNAFSIMILCSSFLILIYVMICLLNNWLQQNLNPGIISIGIGILLAGVLVISSLNSAETKEFLTEEFADRNWLNTFTVMVVPFLGNAYSIFLFRQFFMQMPGELWQAARIDGASHFQYFTRVVVPLNLPAFAIIGLLSFIWSWNSFMWPRLTQIDQTGHFTLPVGIDAFTRAQGVELHLLMAAATITVLPVLALYMGSLKLFMNSASRIGIKS